MLRPRMGHQQKEVQLQKTHKILFLRVNNYNYNLKFIKGSAVLEYDTYSLSERTVLDITVYSKIVTDVVICCTT